MPELPAELVEDLIQVLDTCTSSHYDARAEESFTQCHICNEWEGHHDTCPVPRLEAWLKTEGNLK